MMMMMMMMIIIIIIIINNTATANGQYNTVLSTADIIPNKQYDSWKLLYLRSALHILMQTSATLDTWCRVRKCLAEQ
jgi:hypothetical protein